ncbi:hypothetical protein MATL_G00154960 [Megalops atlanticus]|uniref:Uncharacterized protein n=1 Tax=Megalops atlanticus TaxID=7932 RepID=A0A9D3T5I9_MEGAT|nr:hypothetical protein MATL_G00154960 [Megalops atlanticus]
MLSKENRAALALCAILAAESPKKKRRRVWVRRWLGRRGQYGFCFPAGTGGGSRKSGDQKSLRIESLRKEGNQVCGRENPVRAESTGGSLHACTTCNPN